MAMTNAKCYLAFCKAETARVDKIKPVAEGWTVKFEALPEPEMGLLRYFCPEHQWECVRTGGNELKFY